MPKLTTSRSTFFFIFILFHYNFSILSIYQHILSSQFIISTIFTIPSFFIILFATKFSPYFLSNTIFL